MSDVTVKLNWAGGQAFTAVNSAGIETVLDGNRQAGASPVEILTEALGACSAIDVVVIMEKVRTPLQKLEVVVDADRRATEPRYVENVRIAFDAWGDGINQDKLARAINLSIGKYCSVFHSLRTDLKLVAKFRIHSNDSTTSGDYQEVEMSVPTGELQ
ncbi:MAG: OsmC family protein [Acidobacteria bacterium]|nr:OsmC family protein [Acidobacteriota bacterium]